MSTTTIQAGTITRIVESRGFGFLKPDSGPPEVFFHAYECDRALLPFDESLTERRVKFEAKLTERGPRATKVMAVE